MVISLLFWHSTHQSECEEVQIQSCCFSTNYWRNNSLVPLMTVVNYQWHTELWSRRHISALEWPSGGCWIFRVAMASNNDYRPPNLAVCGDCHRLLGAVMSLLSIITGVKWSICKRMWWCKLLGTSPPQGWGSSFVLLSWFFIFYRLSDGII